MSDTLTIEQAADRLMTQPEAETEAEDTTQDVDVETEEVTDDEVEAAEPEAEETTGEEVEDDEGEQPEVEATDETDEPYIEEDDGNEASQPITVKVDGEEVEVTLDDLKRSFSGQGKIQKGMQEAAEMRKQSEAVFQSLQAEQQRFLASVQALQEQGLKSPPKAPDESLVETDPIGYMQDKAAYDKELAEYQAQQQEIQRVQQQNAEMQQRGQQQYIQEQAQLVQEFVPEFKDPEVATKFKESLVRTGINDYGFTQDEMSSIMDARAIAVLSDAYRWRDLQNSTAKAKKKPTAPKNVKPSAKRRTPKKVERQKKIQKAKQSGKLEDFASLIMNG
jgi:hypothetical protein